MLLLTRTRFGHGSVFYTFRMTKSYSGSRFNGLQTEILFIELVSVDKHLKKFFKTYLHEEYQGDKAKRLDYIDIAEIGGIIVKKGKLEETEWFQVFFDKVETILNNCDSYVNDLLVVGLFETIQNTCGTSVDYHFYFDQWLGKLSKVKWDELIDKWEGNEWRKNTNYR